MDQREERRNVEPILDQYPAVIKMSLMSQNVAHDVQYALKK